jgi:hypothetical protein
MRLLFPLFAFLVPCFFASFLFAANNNPLMRTCRREQGLFWIVYAPNQELPLCFFGEAAIGAEALNGYKNGGGDVMAVTVYKKTISATCEQVGAVTIAGQDSKKANFEVCQFQDGTLIEKQTLLRGQGAAQNAALNRSLNNAY